MKKETSLKNQFFKKVIERKKYEKDKKRTPVVLPEKIKPGGPKKWLGKKPTMAFIFQKTLPYACVLPSTTEKKKVCKLSENRMFFTPSYNPISSINNANRPLTRSRLA